LVPSAAKVCASPSAVPHASGPQPPLAGALDAAPQLHQTGHSRIAQQFFG